LNFSIEFLPAEEVAEGTAETVVAGTRGISLAVVDGFAEASDETMLEISEDEALEGALVVEGREDRIVVEAGASD
jgi:hypothetical protein